MNRMQHPVLQAYPRQQKIGVAFDADRRQASSSTGRTSGERDPLTRVPKAAKRVTCAQPHGAVTL
jgi:hypothetical protein